MIQPDSPNHAQIAREVSAAFPDAGFAFVYGSFETASFRADSDLDLAIHCGVPIAVDQRLEAVGRLEMALQRSVDLLDLFDADPLISRQILQTGRLLFLQRPEALYRFQIKALSSYLDIKLDREVVERAMLAGV